MQRHVRGVPVASVDEAGPSLVDDVGVVLQALVQVVRGQPDRWGDGLLSDAARCHVSLVDGPRGEPCDSAGRFVGHISTGLVAHGELAYAGIAPIGPSYFLDVAEPSFSSRSRTPSGRDPRASSRSWKPFKVKFPPSRLV